MCFGCSKETSPWDCSFEYPQHMFWMRNKENNFPICTHIWRPDSWYWDFEADFPAWKFWNRHIIIIIISDLFSDDLNTIISVWNYLFFESYFWISKSGFWEFSSFACVYILRHYFYVLYIIVVASVWYRHTSLDSNSLSSAANLYTQRQWKVTCIKVSIFRKIYNTALWLLLRSCLWSTTSWFGEIQQLHEPRNYGARDARAFDAFVQYLRIRNHHSEQGFH